MSHVDAVRLADLASGAEPTEAEAEHLIACAACADRVAGPTPSLDGAAPWTPERERRSADRLIVAVKRARRNRLAIVVGGLAVAAVVALALWPSEPKTHAQVGVTAGAATTVHAGHDEVIAIDGAAEVRVRPLPNGDRFRMIAGHDELEVHGTAFRVVGGPDGLARVDVHEGVVAVRTECCGETELRAGQRWDRPPADPGPPDAPEPAPSSDPAPSATSSASPPSASTPRSTDDPMTAATAAFDAGRYAVAATLFDRALAADPSAPWARDARTLSSACHLLALAPAAIANASASPRAFDLAAQRAGKSGDAARARAARLGAARHASGADQKRRYCAIAGDGGYAATERDEARRACGP